MTFEDSETTRTAGSTLGSETNRVSDAHPVSLKGRDSKDRFLPGANWVCAFPGPNLSQKLQNADWLSRSLL